MKLKIQSDSIGLCGSCRHAFVATTVSNRMVARCDWLHVTLREPVSACSKYSDLRLPSLLDMRQTAWILRTGEDKKVIGFVSNQQWRKSKEYRDNPCWPDDDD